jgi:ribosomal protein L7Ae-like RNA K-turn-binding protein
VVNKLLSSLGLCKKAGKLVAGFEAVSDDIKAGKAFLVVTAADLSPKTEKEIQYITEKHLIDHIAAPVTMDEISHWLGRRVGVLAVSDAGLARAVSMAAVRLNEEEQLI